MKNRHCCRCGSRSPLRLPRPAHAETAVLAGGCFWGMEAVFEHVKGVSDVVSGYAGGSAASAHYDGRRTPAMPRRCASPTTQADQLRPAAADIFRGRSRSDEVNRQGPDNGRSYRSAIFPQNAQPDGAGQGVHRHGSNAAHAFKAPIATKIERGGFWPAEAYHQDFARKNPIYPYIVINDRPKVAALKRRYPGLFTAPKALRFHIFRRGGDKGAHRSTIWRSRDSAARLAGEPETMLTTNPFDDDKLREECGVFGIWGADNAASFVALGLHALQHRGQEAAGHHQLRRQAFPLAPGDGPCRRQFRPRRHHPQARRPRGDRPCPLFDHRRDRAAQRPAVVRRACRGRLRGRP